MGRKQTIFLQQDHLDRVLDAFQKVDTECSSTDLERVTGLEMKFIRLALEKLQETKQVETNGRAKRWCRYRLVLGASPQVARKVDLPLVTETIGNTQAEVAEIPNDPCIIPVPTVVEEIPSEGPPSKDPSPRECLDMWIKSPKSKIWVEVADVRDFMNEKNPKNSTLRILEEIRFAIKGRRIDRKTERDRDGRNTRYLTRV